MVLVLSRFHQGGVNTKEGKTWYAIQEKIFVDCIGHIENKETEQIEMVAGLARCLQPVHGNGVGKQQEEDFFENMVEGRTVTKK